MYHIAAGHGHNSFDSLGGHVENCQEDPVEINMCSLLWRLHLAVVVAEQVWHQRKFKKGIQQSVVFPV